MSAQIFGFVWFWEFSTHVEQVRPGCVVTDNPSRLCAASYGL